ncbi:ABC transporter substrate-binding protein, partial [Campylobacter volucris]
FVIFKFYNKNGDWQIYDVDIFGVSIIQTYRSQFKDVLQNADFATLLSKLSNVNFK